MPTLKGKKADRTKFKKPLAQRTKAPKKQLKPAKKPVVRKKNTAPAKKPAEKIIGTVTHYFPKINAAAIKLKAPLDAGTVIWIKGHTTDFTQTVASMQLDHVTIASAKKGQEIGVLVQGRVRRHDTVTLA